MQLNPSELKQLLDKIARSGIARHDGRKIKTRRNMLRKQKFDEARAIGVFPMETSEDTTTLIKLDLIMHAPGYNGSGGILNITVGIDPASVHPTEMQVPAQNSVMTWNGILPVLGNLNLGSTNEIPSGMFYFESVAVHELGHSLGLTHCNLGSESGLPEPERNYTHSTDGSGNNCILNPGQDIMIGSPDDQRGDNESLHYYNIWANDPFRVQFPVDLENYSRNPSYLPAGHMFPSNAERNVSVVSGYPQTETVMQQGALIDEVQRRLSADDVATLHYAMCGLDEMINTADDYTINLVYMGLAASADIVIEFDAGATSFASSSNGSVFLTTDHDVNNPSGIYFNPNYNLYFKDQLNTVEVSLSVNNLYPSNDIESITGTLELKLDMDPGSTTEAVDWYFPYMVDQTVNWATSGGCPRHLRRW